MKQTLAYYFERAGVITGGDNYAEINEIVDLIVDAAVAATRAELIRVADRRASQL